MNAVEKFWEKIAELIKSEYGKGHPTDWDKNKIIVFLEDFHAKLEVICREDKRKASLCGVIETKTGTTPGPTTSYYSFRRIFLTKESSGNRTTREMFAIYLGYDSAYDFMTKGGIVEEPRAQAPEPPEEASSQSWRRRWITIVTVLIIIVLLLLNKCTGSPSAGADRHMIVRNDDGIAWINMSNGHTFQVVEKQPEVIGIDFDPKTRTLYWANKAGHYRCISRVQMNESFTGTEEMTLNHRLTKPILFPTGIALDTKNKWIYCADYRDSVILKYDYQGNLLNSSLVGKLKGQPSSVELDVKKQILYWTDVTTHKIGRMLLKKSIIEPEFIPKPGIFPDGLSLDTIRNRLYWAVNGETKIGWVDLAAPEPQWIKLANRPSSVEIDAQHNILYYTLLNSDMIDKISLPVKKGIYRASIKNTFPANGPSPGVVKLIDLKRK